MNGDGDDDNDDKYDGDDGKVDGGGSDDDGLSFGGNWDTVTVAFDARIFFNCLCLNRLLSFALVSTSASFYAIAYIAPHT